MNMKGAGVKSAVALLVVAGGLVAWAFKGSFARRIDESLRHHTCPVGMTLIPAGTFLMGSPEGQGRVGEHPQQSVQFDAFCMDRTEVTVARYRACASSGACTPAGATVEFSDATASVHRIFDGICNGARAGQETHPINQGGCIKTLEFLRVSRSRGECGAPARSGSTSSLSRTLGWSRGPTIRC